VQSSVFDKIVMVTGAGGSIGSEICRQAQAAGPRALVLFESSEPALYRVSQQLMQSGLDVPVYPILGSVLDQCRVTEVIRQFGVNTIYHAAAYKHVPIVEHNVLEGVRNNVFGTQVVARAAAALGVDRFVLVSTDKAVRPTNVMGATKRLAELILQDLAAHKPGRSTPLCVSAMCWVHPARLCRCLNARFVKVGPSLLPIPKSHASS
jgi:Predicted nucleoside-diphosphate sugar epimerases